MADPGASSISVAVRVRPFTIREAAQLSRTDDSTVFLGDGSLAAAPAPKLHQRGIRSVIKVVDDRCLVFDPPEDNPVQKFSRSVVPTGKKVKDQVFAFDRIFDDNATQTEVYEGTTKKLLDSVLDGYNATVFAYGATGCGKTHTITGTPQMPGIIFLTMQELFEKIHDRSDEKVTEVTLSYLEIYNETIRDLLVPGGSKQGLMLREDTNQAVTVSGLTSHHPKDVQEVMDMIVKGNEYRTVSPTEANATSSRSHAVLQINVAQRDRNADVTEPHTMATLSIIDLAGSERASATKNRGERLMEGANINKSLLALGSCINALCDARRRNHVPYRNSKLTRLLKFSLGGNCKTVMIVCVSPSSAHFDETQNTLRYANRAKNIQTKVTRNVFNVNRHVKDFLVKIDEQMALIKELKAQQKDAEALFFAKFRKQGEKRDAACREGVQRLRQAYENSLPQRQEKIASMRRLKMFERRGNLLSAWLAAFDSVCEARGDEVDMPGSLMAVRKTAQGVLVELETSRHHLRQKIDASNWERAVDTALQHSLKLLPEGDTGSSQVATLQREAELLKANFAKEMYREALEGEKGGDAQLVQVLLEAQFEMVASLADTLAMSEEDAVAHAKTIIHKLLETGVTAASHVVKPDSAPPAVEAFPPTRKGTPRKKRPAASAKTVPQGHIPQPVFTQAVAVTQMLSPTKPSSPRRRKTAGLARKGVSFTPKPPKRSVRWRGDEGEEGPLVEFQRTPKPYESTPEGDSELMMPKPPTFSTGSPLAHPTSQNPSRLHMMRQDNSDSSPSIDLPDTSTISFNKPNRFQAGFLSKGASRPAPGPRSSNSPVLVAPSLTLNLASSDNEDSTTSPLRSLDVTRASNMSPPSMLSRLKSPSPSSARGTPPPNRSIDENNPPAGSAESRIGSPMSIMSGSDADSPLDARKLRSAISAKRQAARRASLISAPTGLRRPSTEYPAFSRTSIGSTGSAAPSNGVSRNRRDSAERRRSPPISCSPPEVRGGGSGLGKAFTPGQARRMNLGGSLRTEGGSSPPKDGVGQARRVTIGGVAQRKDAPRASAGWR